MKIPASREVRGSEIDNRVDKDIKQMRGANNGSR